MEAILVTRHVFLRGLGHNSPLHFTGSVRRKDGRANFLRLGVVLKNNIRRSENMASISCVNENSNQSR